MFGIGPAYLFFLQHRLPVGQMRGGWRPWVSAMATNLGIGLAAAGLIWLVGLKAFLLVHLPIMLLAASLGVWLFYVQHQFEQTSWDRDEDWTLQAAALHGSSHYDLPALPALVHRQYRHAPCSSSEQPHPVLPAAARAARSSGAARCRPADPAAEPALRAPRAVGREAPPPDIVQGASER